MNINDGTYIQMARIWINKHLRWKYICFVPCAYFFFLHYDYDEYKKCEEQDENNYYLHSQLCSPIYYVQRDFFFFSHSLPCLNIEGIFFHAVLELI